MLPGETLHSGAPTFCDECQQTFEPQVMQSAAGWYVGTSCRCGPNTRESGYCPSPEAAAELLRIGTYSRTAPAAPPADLDADAVLTLVIFRC
ncbi:hypothetical protein [Pyxidicoccus sp. MSG2]|uniref:hypothetical protein n=1 Tax=Pyxidicoccus sp. MSG2 TaxID=2996790 RepID=UPI00226DCC55|nr:hypothetical protein [Pyxidicoccus sp. MSG2]MCY1024052.1 hypothetical protein [Pyxidicoccus sp. MSG2]